MNEEDYKAVIASYQQKAFELFNQNIVLETQINSLRKSIENLSIENEKLKKSKKPIKQDSGDFV
jgi:prefoldin subunit 5